MIAAMIWFLCLAVVAMNLLLYLIYDELRRKNG